jgi:hypothetical protein
MFDDYITFDNCYLDSFSVDQDSLSESYLLRNYYHHEYDQFNSTTLKEEDDRHEFIPSSNEISNQMSASNSFLSSDQQYSFIDLTEQVASTSASASTSTSTGSSSRSDSSSSSGSGSGSGSGGENPKKIILTQKANVPRKKTPEPYPNIILKALLSSEDQKLQLNGIYDYMIRK